MHVTVRLFAGLRERAGAGELTLELPAGARVADALRAVGELTEGIPVVMAVNREYAEETQTLQAGDELALIPPVSGGAERTDVIHARVSAEPLSLDLLLAFVRDPRAGAVVTFAGVTREVAALEYEAYAEMALPQMISILERAIARHGLCAAAVEHRTGTVELSEPSVLIAVSAPHRAEAFAGGREIIDELKRVAPIWKQEEGEWVRGTTPAPGPDA
ncbi:MAG TPA: molybdenum cofactor biosynthesis protein MoaE [Solirubrobacteraceae bacterium]|nr:molybdenum cofactor biosynthesis protein MoaE [Solirubrobacteraceae bacterium]